MNPPDGRADPGPEASLDAPSTAFLDLLRRAVPPADPRLRSEIGRFAVLGELGHGGFGTVLLVRDPRLGRERALKVPNPRTMASPAALERFLDEARKAARVDHPNVVRVLEAGEDGPVAYLVMELCPDGSLSRWLASRPAGSVVPARWAASLVAEVADGVAAAHAAGLLHRDLKPGNVLLSRLDPGDRDDPPAYCPQVADFGLARLLDDGDGPTASGVMVGTLPYMSPEAARGDRSAGEAADVYGLGAILFHVLTGERPFAGSSDAETLSQILGAAPPPSPRSSRGDLPRDLETICLTALAKSPADRYPTARAMAEDLRRFLRGDPVRGSAWWRRARSHLKRRRRFLLAAAAIGLAAWGATWGVRYKRRLDALAWIGRVEAAAVDALPALLREHDPADPLVSGRLAAMFAGDDPARKLAASAALAAARGPCADYALDRLLSADPAEVGPIARALDGRVPGLLDRLGRLDREAPAPGDDEPTARDRRRCNAAAALWVLGRVGPGLGLLAFSPDAGARSRLVHTLGPAGADPKSLLAALDDPSRGADVRRSLVQALGQVPPSAWADGDRSRALAAVARLYRDDPDPGVHGSAKWLLRAWGAPSAITEADAALASRRYRQGFGWRVDPSGLTFVAVPRFEISDTEVPRSLFLLFRPEHRFEALASPAPECPMTSVNYLDAAAFCNWLSLDAGLTPDQFRYRQGTRRWPDEQIDFEPVSGGEDLAGYRLPTDLEFEHAARARTRTRWFHGDAPDLLPSYAHYARTAELSTRPAGLLKPNDFGLFDALGNAYEVCQVTGPRAVGAMQAVFCGGSILEDELNLAFDRRLPPSTVYQRQARAYLVGFRVARNLSPAP